MAMRSIRTVLAALFAAVILSSGGQAETKDPPADLELYHALNLIYKGAPENYQGLDWILARGKPDMAAHLITSMRYSRLGQIRINHVLQQITGEEQRRDWYDWMLWQEANPQIKPHRSLQAFKAAVFEALDPDFARFYRFDTELTVRPEEVTWGGVPVDGIPALDNPNLIAAAEADYLLDSDEVFGVEINGDARAYPLRIMGWHEMFNDVVGGVPVSLAYCTLCGAGILFEGNHPALAAAGVEGPLTFGSTGLLYRSNKVMYDRNTDSIWNQFTGEPIGGRLLGTDIQLAIRPVVITTWAKWRAKHPDTKVLSLETGFRRNYGSGVVYEDYFESTELMFPALGDAARRLKQKDQVFGMRLKSGTKAWPLSAFAGGKVLNDKVGTTNVVLIGDAESRTVRAYDRGDHSFTGEGFRTSDGQVWRLTEDALIAADGQRLPRLPGHVSYWFAWAGYLGDGSALFGQ